MLLSVQCIFSLAKVSFERIDLLLSQANFIFKVCNHLLVFLNCMRQLPLNHLQLILMVVRLVPQLRFVLLNQIVGATRVTLLLILESLFKSLLLRLIELPQLVKLLLRLLIDFLQLTFMQPFLFLQLYFKFLQFAMVSCCKIINKSGFVGFEALAGLPQLISFLFGMSQVFSQHLVFFSEISVSQLQFEF